MAATVPTREPKQLNAGDSWSWDRTLSDYSAAAGWALAYHLRGPASLDIGAGAGATWVTGAGDTFSVRVPATGTASLTAGTYRLVGYATKATERVEVFNAVVILRPNFATAGASAALSHDERTLAILDAAIEGRLPQDLQSYQINGRAVNKIPIKELVELQDLYRARVNRQRRQKRFGRTVEVKLG